MDRRQQKSRNAIFNAFSKLLKKKHYNRITVNDIIEEADVCRSTFYSHFETKEMLTLEMCREIFDHIFEGEICDYSEAEETLEGELAHVLYHIKNGKFDIAKILPTEGGEVFMRYFKEYLERLFSAHIKEFSTAVPREFFINHLVGGFSEAVKWWINGKMKESPEDVAKYFMSVVETH